MEIPWWTIWLAAIAGTYLIGGIPFGLLIARAKGVDIRQHGSRNIGASNVGRTLGRKWGILTFTLDMLKGFVPVLAAGYTLGTLNQLGLPPERIWAWLAFGLAATLGHTYTPFLKFKGGKGVATGFGSLIAVYPILTIPAIATIFTWAACVAISRYMGFSSCMAALCMPLWAMGMPWFGRKLGYFEPEIGEGELLGIWPYLTLAFMMALLVVWRHRSNLGRMLAGTEPKVKTRAERRAEQQVARDGVPSAA